MTNAAGSMPRDVKKYESSRSCKLPLKSCVKWNGVGLEMSNCKYATSTMV